MESLNSVDSLNDNPINKIDGNDVVALKNKALNNDNEVRTKEDILATAKYNPEEEEKIDEPKDEKKGEEQNKEDEEDNKKESIEPKEQSFHSIESIKKEKNKEKTLNVGSSVNISNSLTENIINESNDIANEDEYEEDLTQKSFEASLNSEKLKESSSSEKDNKKEEGEEEEDEEKEKEEEDQNSKETSDETSENTIKKDHSLGGSENVLVNKLINKVQEEEGTYPLGSTDSLSKRKLHMNKKFQELRDSQANLDRAMSVEDHFTKKEGKGLSDNDLNKITKEDPSDSEEEEEDHKESDMESENDEVFDIELIRKFEKRNTIHIPLHKRNYANINSVCLRPEFSKIKVTEGIEKIVEDLFVIIENNIKPIMQSDGLSRIFLKNIESSKEEEAPDFDITTISEEVGKLMKQDRFEEAYNLIILKVNNNYRVQICEEILTTINSIIVLFCLEERVQTTFKSFYTQNYSRLDRSALLEVMNTVDIISPPEKILLGNCAYYLIHSKNKKLAPETYKELANALFKNLEYNYALHVLDNMGRQHWDKKTYQMALDLCIKTKPQKLAYAESLLEDYGQPYIVAKNENSLVPIIISTPLMIGTTKQDIKEMRNYYKELLRVFKWKMALDNFETAKNAIYTKKEMLQLKNAMLELCVTYKEFQHGWSIFQGMTECNKNTAQVAITLCREAINFNNEMDEQDTYRIGWVNRAWDIVTSLKEWALYNMPIIVGKKSSAAIRKNKRNMINVSEHVYNKLRDYYKPDKNDENAEGTSASKEKVDKAGKRKKSIFGSAKPVELPKHLAKSNFNLSNIDRSSMISIIAFVLHEILCIFETVPNMEIFLLHLVEIYNFLYENSINEILCDEYLIRPIIRFCLKCRLGERYKKFNFNNLPTEDSFMKDKGVKFSTGETSSNNMSEEETKFNIERAKRRGRCMSVNKNQQMNDILFEHIKNNIKKTQEEAPTPTDPEFEKEKNKICTRIALDCYYNICGGSTEQEVKKCHSNTYAMILHFAILENNAKLFEDICNDLWYARIQLDEEVVMALQVFHDNHLEACSGCSEKDHFYSAEVTVKPYKYEKQKFIVLNGIRMRTPLDLSFLKKIGTINGRPYSQEEARKFLNHCINACNPNRRLSMSI